MVGFFFCILLDDILYADNSLNGNFGKSFKTFTKIDSAHIVYGQVYDSLSKKAVPDVKIFLRGSADTAMTEEKDGYRLWIQDNFLRSKQTLVFQHREYETRELVITTINYPINLDISLIKLSTTKKRARRQKKGSH